MGWAGSGQLRWWRDRGLTPIAHPCGAAVDRRLLVLDMARGLEADDFLGEAFRAEFCQCGKVDFLGKRLFRFVLFDAVDFFAKVTGAFTAEGVLHAFGKAVILRILDDHRDPRVGLDQSIGASRQMQATANDHKKLKKLLQGFDPWVKHGAEKAYGRGPVDSRIMKAVLDGFHAFQGLKNSWQ